MVNDYISVSNSIENKDNNEDFFNFCREMSQLAAAGKSEEISAAFQEEYFFDTNDLLFSDDFTKDRIYRLIYACVATACCCETAGLPPVESGTLSAQYIKSGGTCGSNEEAAELLKNMLLAFSARMKILSGASAAYPSIRRSVDYINTHYQSKISVRQLAAAVGYNRSHLAVIFKRETGLTITEYIRNVRIREAKRLIAEGQPLSGISHAVGFSSQSHFCQSFRMVTGITPKEYISRIQVSRKQNML